MVAQMLLSEKKIMNSLRSEGKAISSMTTVTQMVSCFPAAGNHWRCVEPVEMRG